MERAVAEGFRAFYGFLGCGGGRVSHYCPKAEMLNIAFLKKLFSQKGKCVIGFQNIYLEFYYG